MAVPSSSDQPKLVDRLTNLPEHILLHILSFLPTKTAAKTSVLSKPWQHLWTLVPTIDIYTIDDYRFARRDDFGDIVGKVLDSNKAPAIRRLRLGGWHCTSSLDKWLSSATEHNVEELDLTFIPNNDATLTLHCAPQSLKTLVAMKVIVYHSHTRLHFVIGDLYLPALKSLHVNTTVFETLDPSLSGFFSSRFPLLEELVVEGNEFSRDISISLPMLRRLEVSKTYTAQRYSLNIEAPSLQYLVLREVGNGDLRVENLHNLVEANVDVWNRRLGNKDGEYGESLINFLNALSNVKMLGLSHDTMKALRNASFHSLFQHFHNLVKLDLQLDRSGLLGVPMIMLSNFENLEHLTIVEYHDRSENCFAPPTHVPNCLTYRLKTFCFRCFEGSNYGIEFCTYILKNSLVLESAKVLFSPSLIWKEACRSRAILSTTTKGSSECQLEFDQEATEGRTGRYYGSD